MLDDCYCDRYSSGRVLSEAVSEAEYDDFGGYCEDCGEYFDVDDFKPDGVVFKALEEHQLRKIDSKYRK